jgi:osmoprotectant transport system permease protein
METLRTIGALRATILALGLRHLEIVAIAVALSTLAGVTLGVLVSRHRRVGRVVVGAANIGQAIPSLAILGLVIPFLGIGPTPTIFALVLRGMLPILNNTYAGLASVDRATVEAGRGMGMRGWQVLAMVEFPLAFPVVMAGIRSATVVSISLATIAALIGGGGLGDLIYQGLAMMDAGRLLAGSIPVAFLAVAADALLGWAQRAASVHADVLDRRMDRG